MRLILDFSQILCLLRERRYLDLIFRDSHSLLGVKNSTIVSSMLIAVVDYAACQFDQISRQYSLESGVYSSSSYHNSNSPDNVIIQLTFLLASLVARLC